MNTGGVNAGEILRARARALARPVEPLPRGETRIEVLEFELARERYAVESRFVSEVCPLEDLTPLPCTPPFVRGIISVRGRILPVLDLKKFFDLPEKGLTDLNRVVLVRGNDLELGLLADLVVGMRSISADELQSFVPTLEGIRAEYLKGVTSERVVVLDLARILADRRIIVHEEIHPQQLQGKERA